MTDTEIMKGVKLCNGDLGNCKECPFDSIGKTCGIELAKAEIGLIERLQAENAALRERLDKAVLGKCIYYINSVWNDATMTRKEEVCQGTVDYVCDNFVEVAGLVLKWDEIYFTREAAEARLAELKGEKK